MNAPHNPFIQLGLIPLPKELEETVFGRVARASIVAKEHSASLRKIALFERVYSARIDRLKRVYENIRGAHQFYVDICDAVYEGGYQNLLLDLEFILNSTKIVKRIGDYYTRRIATDPQSHMKFRKAFLGRAGAVIRNLGPHIERLKAGYVLLKELPNIEPTAFKVVVAGAPHVGKSSLVSRITGVRIQIGSYPFTTKRINAGVIAHGGIKIIIFDTPGLLDRPLERRSAAEVKAVSALRYLSNLIIFLIDPTEKAGYSQEYQQALLHTIQNIFKETEILVAYTHADEFTQTSGRLSISNKTGSGIDVLVSLISTKARSWYALNREDQAHGPSKPQLGHL